MNKKDSDYDIVKQLMAFTGKIAWPTIYLFLFSFGMYVIVLLSGALNLIPLSLGCLLNIVLAYLLFTPLHEAGHQNIKGKRRNLKWMENTIGWLSGATLLAPYPLVRYLHNEHHKHTNDPVNDPDYWVSSTNYLLLFLKCLTIYFKYIFAYTLKSRIILKNPQLRIEHIQNVLSFILAFSLLIYWGNVDSWHYPVFLVILPAFIAQGILAFAFDWLPHHPHALQQKYLDTRILLLPGLTTLLVSQNMHLIHHLYAGIPFYHYKKALQILEPKLREKGAEIKGGHYSKE